MSGDIVCGLYCAHEDEEHKFLGLASKLRSTGFSVLASKLAAPV
jgi:hypothetical protein